MNFFWNTNIDELNYSKHSEINLSIYMINRAIYHQQKKIIPSTIWLTENSFLLWSFISQRGHKEKPREVFVETKRQVVPASISDKDISVTV